MAETKKAAATVKKVEAKAEKKVAAVKAAAEKKAAPVKEAVEKKAAPVKAAVEKKAAAVKKAPAKKATKKVDTKASLNVQFGGKDYKEADLIKMAKDAYKKSGNKDALKTINVYANIDDQVAYYVANGSIEGSFEI